MNILVTGSTGLVGSCLVDRVFRKDKLHNWTFSNSQTCNLFKKVEILQILNQTTPDIIIHLAGRVGGIKANKENQLAFLNDNATMSLNLMNMSYFVNPNIKVITMLSTCIYPEKLDPGFYPLWEDLIEDGPPQPTNEGYAVGKRLLYSLVKLYNREHNTKHVGLIPSNLYGPGDHFDSPDAHFLAAMISKIKKCVDSGSNTIKLMGNGKPYRQFTYVEDLVTAILACVDKPDISGFFNIATPESKTIRELAEIALKVTGNSGINLEFDAEDGLTGQYNKDVSANKFDSTFGKLNYTSLEDGIRKTWDFYNAN